MDYYPFLVRLIVWIDIVVVSFVLFIALVFADAAGPYPLDGTTLSPWQVRLIAAAWAAPMLFVFVNVLRARLWAYYVYLALTALVVVEALLDGVRDKGLDVLALVYSLVSLSILLGYFRDFKWVANHVKLKSALASEDNTTR